jgi:hypothetical protein
MKKLLTVLGIGLLFASCEPQPNLDADSIDPAALRELKHGRVDTVLVVATEIKDHNYYEYHFFKNDKDQTFKGSVRKYNDFDSILVVMILCFFVFGFIISGIVLSNK